MSQFRTTDSGEWFPTPEAAGAVSGPMARLFSFTGTANEPMDRPLGSEVAAFEDAKPLWHPDWRDGTIARQKHDKRHGIKPREREQE